MAQDLAFISPVACHEFSRWLTPYGDRSGPKRKPEDQAVALTNECENCCYEGKKPFRVCKNFQPHEMNDSLVPLTFNLRAVPVIGTMTGSRLS